MSRRMPRVALPLALVAAIAGACPASAAADELEYPVKAEFIERFTRFIDWPTQVFAGPDAPFVLCVVGSTPMEAHLERIAGRRLKERRVELRRLKPTADAGACHLLFVAGSERGHIKQIITRLSGKPVLTVGDSEGFAREGVLINLILDEDGHVRFEICSNELRKSGLNVSAQLLRLARVVTEVQP
ncbi:MAG: hypothetical protein JWN44_6609 [Myxococcales bacterium]|nr:hypothetical protein [Myxococcales bacterium]